MEQGVEQSVYDAVGGMPALVRLAHAWHERCLADPLVSHAFSHGFHPDHTARLAAYWAEALGGPADYSRTIQGQSDVVRMHSGNGPHDEMDRLALGFFVAALDDAGIPDDPRLRATLTEYFDRGIAELNHTYETEDDVPEGLPMSLWSWDGPVR